MPFVLNDLIYYATLQVDLLGMYRARNHISKPVMFTLPCVSSFSKWEWEELLGIMIGRFATADLQIPTRYLE